MKLRVSLDSLLAAEHVGRWWIVGSSWSGAPMINEPGNTTTKQCTAEGQVESNYGTVSMAIATSITLNKTVTTLFVSV